MNTLTNFALQHKYEKVKQLRSRLEEMNDLIEWDKFLALFPDKETKVGRPAYDLILKLKLLFLQSWHSLSDEELEFQVYDRLSFQQFLGFPEEIPDYSTVWRFRESLIEGKILDTIWNELQRQLDEKCMKVENGMIQDARFVHADPGKKNSGMKDRGWQAKTSRSKDGTWTKKNKKSIFGFKLHTKVGLDTKFIREAAITTAKTFDGHVDLAKPHEVVYRDRGYSGVNTKAKGDGTMKKGRLSPKQKLRNYRITRKRCRGEHPYGTMQRSFKSGSTKLTTNTRVFVQQVFVCMAYNVHRLRFLAST